PFRGLLPLALLNVYDTDHKCVFYLCLCGCMCICVCVRVCVCVVCVCLCIHALFCDHKRVCVCVCVVVGSVDKPETVGEVMRESWEWHQGRLVKSSLDTYKAKRTRAGFNT